MFYNIRSAQCCITRISRIPCYSAQMRSYRIESTLFTSVVTFSFCVQSQFVFDTLKEQVDGSVCTCWPLFGQKDTTNRWVARLLTTRIHKNPEHPQSQMRSYHSHMSGNGRPIDLLCKFTDIFVTKRPTSSRKPLTCSYIILSKTISLWTENGKISYDSVKRVYICAVTRHLCGVTWNTGYCCQCITMSPKTLMDEP